MSELLKTFANCSTQNAVIQHIRHDAKKELTYGDLRCQSNRFAQYLQSLGLKTGEFIGLFMIRSSAHVVAMVSALRCGAVFYSIQPKYSIYQIASTIRACRTSMIISDNAGLIKLSAMEADLIDGTRFIHFDEDEMAPFQKEALDRLSRRWEVYSFRSDLNPMRDDIEIEAKRREEEPALALFTSGSTGAPKGVLVSCEDLNRRVLSEYEAYRLSSSDRLLNLLPFSFDVGLNQLHSSLRSGAQIVLMNSWLPQDIAAAVEKYKITGISAVPSIWSDVLSQRESLLFFSKNSLRYLTVSGGDMPRRRLQQLRDLFPHADIYKTYGQTEAFRSCMLTPEDFSRKMTSIGRTLEQTKVYVMTSDGRKAGPNEPGEILHQGMGTMLGYIDDPQATQRKMRKNPFSARIDDDLVVFTGDLGKFDDDGYLYFLGRMDDMLKIRGNRIYPKEIEAALSVHEEVQESLVLGIKDERDETQICAVVQLRRGSTVTESEIKKFLSGRLPTYMAPRWIHFVRAFPRTGSGKIDKKKAAAMIPQTKSNHGNDPVL
ncbi:MAG: AMP-binding protein [Candidatus Omnitrophica bacterium]|nr:AMP-binding protein [Candidatus Omnitrophota bacterium]